MSAGAHNFNCEQGATWRRVIRARDASGEPIDLTGYTARMQVRKVVDAPDVLVELSTSNGRITLDDEGYVTLLLAASVTASLTRPGVYDLEIVSPSGEVTRLIEGEFRLKKEVTR